MYTIPIVCLQIALHESSPIVIDRMGISDTGKCVRIFEGYFTFTILSKMKIVLCLGKITTNLNFVRVRSWI